MSDDGTNALTLIAFIGSVFSPHYFRARRSTSADPENHCAMNVAVYANGRTRWSFTEYARESVNIETDALNLGRNVASWDGTALTVRIDERAAPVPSRIRGVVRLYPQFLTSTRLALDLEGLHHWQPLAPRARLEVDLKEPRLQWLGSAYLDTNAGAAPLDESFDAWTWSRGNLGAGAAVIYDVMPRKGSAHTIALQFSAHGETSSFAAPVRARLPTTTWRLARTTRSDDAAAKLVATLEDGPFYARSIVAARWLGKPITAIHESLSLRRFRSGWVRALLPFRMRRERRR